MNVSSISALRPRGLTAYTVSKGAVIALTKAIAVDHGADGIRANCATAMRKPRRISLTPSAPASTGRLSTAGLRYAAWNVGYGAARAQARAPSVAAAFAGGGAAACLIHCAWQIDHRILVEKSGRQELEAADHTGLHRVILRTR